MVFLQVVPLVPAEDGQEAHQRTEDPARNNHQASCAALMRKNKD